MSKVGRTPVQLPSGVEVKVDPNGRIQVKGSKGTIQVNPELPNFLGLEIQGQTIVIVTKEVKGVDKRYQSQQHGLFRSLVNNAVSGVTKGWEKQLKINGVGFRAEVKGKNLDLKIGFSHPTMLAIPTGIEVALADNGTTINVKGMDKILVGKFCAELRGMKEPEPYKGKGIQYVGERIRKKEGKAAAGAKK
jgi:large subunit ribosomal protein L6